MMTSIIRLESYLPFGSCDLCSADWLLWLILPCSPWETYDSPPKIPLTPPPPFVPPPHLLGDKEWLAHSFRVLSSPLGRVNFVLIGFCDYFWGKWFATVHFKELLVPTLRMSLIIWLPISRCKSTVTTMASGSSIDFIASIKETVRE